MQVDFQIIYLYSWTSFPIKREVSGSFINFTLYAFNFELMNRLITFLFLVCIALSGTQAQNEQSVTKKGLPTFKIQKTDGKYATPVNLKKDIPVMVVYFDPDCDHCTQFISTLIKQANLFSKVQLVLVTYVSLQQVKTYVKASGLDKYPQIMVGTEGTDFAVRYYYNVIQFPYLALHDKTGKLFATFENEVPTPVELARMF